VSLPFEDLERLYDRLAAAIDRVGPERESLLLAKLALLLAERLGDYESAVEAVAAAERDLT
jgi:hypothetical protein